MTIPERVVVIGEPDDATRLMYQRALAAAFRVIAVAGEEAVLECLSTRPVTLLILEPTLLGDHGAERLSMVGRICGERNILFVICSTQDERRRGLEVGAAAYLVKPTLPNQLLQVVSEVIAGAARRV